MAGRGEGHAVVRGPIDQGAGERSDVLARGVTRDDRKGDTGHRSGPGGASIRSHGKAEVRGGEESLARIIGNHRRELRTGRERDSGSQRPSSSKIVRCVNFPIRSANGDQISGRIHGNAVRNT